MRRRIPRLIGKKYLRTRRNGKTEAARMYKDGDRYILIYPHVMKMVRHYEVVATGPFKFYVLDKKTKKGVQQEYGYEIVGTDPSTGQEKTIKIFYGQKNFSKAEAYYKRIRGEKSVRAKPFAVAPFSIDKYTAGRDEVWAVWGYDATGEPVAIKAFGASRGAYEAAAQFLRDHADEPKLEIELSGGANLESSSPIGGRTRHIGQQVGSQISSGLREHAGWGGQAPLAKRFGGGSQLSAEELSAALEASLGRAVPVTVGPGPSQFKEIRKYGFFDKDESGKVVKKDVARDFGAGWSEASPLEAAAIAGPDQGVVVTTDPEVARRTAERLGMKIVVGGRADTVTQQREAQAKATSRYRDEVALAQRIQQERAARLESTKKFSQGRQILQDYYMETDPTLKKFGAAMANLAKRRDAILDSETDSDKRAVAELNARMKKGNATIRERLESLLRASKDADVERAMAWAQSSATKGTTQYRDEVRPGSRKAALRAYGKKAKKKASRKTASRSIKHVRVHRHLPPGAVTVGGRVFRSMAEAQAWAASQKSNPRGGYVRAKIRAAKRGIR